MYIVFVITAVVLILLGIAVRRRNLQIRDLRSAEHAIVAVDLEAFRNLIDVQQDRFIREHLPPREFRRVQRARYLAAAEYLRNVIANTSVMIRLGELAHASHEPAVEMQGTELAAAAAAARLYCLLSLFQAYVGVLFPAGAMSFGRAIESYDRLTVRVWTIGRAWTPARSAT